MIYLICFLASFGLLFYLIGKGRINDFQVLVLSLTFVAGNGGYYALYEATNLQEAILANKLTYVIGCFTPMIMFFILCNLCKRNIPLKIVIGLYVVQCLLFLSVCTSGKSPMFYKTIDFASGEYGAYLIKTYGPMHTVYLISMCLYLLGSIYITGDAIRRRRCRISYAKANVLLSLYLTTAVIYFVERIAGIHVELMPIVFTATGSVIISIYVNISNYSAYGNLSILEDKNKEIAYIVFNNRLMYMSCNDYALELFPELSDWEIERKIPGSGGRFNTFLRIAFMEYVESGKVESSVDGFIYNQMYYRVEYSRLNTSSKRNVGYVIEVALDVARTREIDEERKTN